MNRVTLKGTVEKAPKFRNLNGEAVLNLFLKGETSRGNIHIPVALKGVLAEKLAERIEVGKTLFVDGELDWESYERNGAKTYQTVIVASHAFVEDD